MILVTGGMGFIGLHTARSLLDLGEDVTITRYRTTRLPSFLADEVGKRLTVAPLDLSDTEAVKTTLRAHDVKSIVHLAVPPRTNLTPLQEMIGSTSATLGLLSAAVACGVTRITAASSLAVYFGLPASEGPFTEDQRLPLSASHPIEANKKIDEVIEAFLSGSGALRIVRARIGGIWGPTYHSMLNAPSRLAMVALERRDKIAGRPDPLDAHPDDMLDLLYVRDCGRALAELHVAEPPNDVYNITVGGMTRYGDLVDAFNRAVPQAGLKLTSPRSEPVGGATGYCDNQRLRNDIGFAPRWDLQAAVQDYVAWLTENEQ